jgi:hypothetical protein
VINPVSPLIKAATCAETAFWLIPACRQAGSLRSEAPARIAKRVMQYAPLKLLECIPAQIDGGFWLHGSISPGIAQKQLISCPPVSCAVDFFLLFPAVFHV